MFAAGRILRNNRQPSTAQPSGLLAPQRTRRKTNRKFRCYVPFMWSALMMTCIGTAIILTGVGMCFTGYYFGSFAKARVVSVSGDHLDLAVDIEMTSTGRSSKVNSSILAAAAAETAAAAAAASHQDHLTSKGLIYAGPVIMSFGCFAIVFACVIVCETRDRAIETIEDRVRRGLPELPADGLRPDFYKLVVQYRLARLEKQRLRRIRQNAQRQEGVVERERLSCCDGGGDVISGAECEHSSFTVEAVCRDDDVEQSVTHEFPSVSPTPDERLVDGFGPTAVEKYESPQKVGKPLAYQIENETDTRPQYCDVAVDNIRWNSVPSVLRREMEQQNTVCKSHPMVTRSRSISSSQRVVQLIGSHPVSGSDATLPKAQVSGGYHRCTSASTSALADASPDTGNRSSPVSTGTGIVSVPMPLDCCIPTRRSLSVLVHVHATVDMHDRSIERDDNSSEKPFADVIEHKTDVDSMRLDDEIGISCVEMIPDRIPMSTGDDDNNATKDEIGRVYRQESNDGNMNVISSTNLSSSDDFPLSTDSNLRHRLDCNSEQPIYRPLLYLKTYMEQPLSSTVVANSRPFCSLDELRRLEAPLTTHRQRHIFTTTRRPESGSTSSFENVSGRFGRRQRVLDSLAASQRQTVSSCGGSVDLLMFGAPESTPLSDGGLDGFGESVPMASVAVVAHDEHSDTLSSSWCDLNSDTVTSPRERNANRRARHHSFSVTVAPRHYLSRMRAWKAKRSSGSSTGNTVIAKPRSDISRLDGSTFIDCDPLKETWNSPIDDVTIRREAQKHRYQFPVVSPLSTSKTRLHPARGARLKRPISPVVSVLQAS